MHHEHIYEVTRDTAKWLAISNRPATEVRQPYLEQRTSTDLKVQATITLKLQWSTQWENTDLYKQNKVWRQDNNLYLRWHNHMSTMIPNIVFIKSTTHNANLYSSFYRLYQWPLLVWGSSTSIYVRPHFQRQKGELATTLCSRWYHKIPIILKEQWGERYGKYLFYSFVSSIFCSIPRTFRRFHSITSLIATLSTNEIHKWR